MIPWFSKLKHDGILVEHGSLLDLGCGNGEIGEQFTAYGYSGILVHADPRVLAEARDPFRQSKVGPVRFLEQRIEDFAFEASYDGMWPGDYHVRKLEPRLFVLRLSVDGSRLNDS